MSAVAAARLGDEVAHGFGMLAMLAGAQGRIDKLIRPGLINTNGALIINWTNLPIRNRRWLLWGRIQVITKPFLCARYTEIGQLFAKFK